MMKIIKYILKTFFKGVTLIAVICVMVFTSGCKRSVQKMKAPDTKKITRENIHGVVSYGDDNIWIVGNYGLIYHSSNEGENWIKQDSGVKETILCDGFFVDPMTGWVVGVYGVILHTTDGGATWTRQDPGTDRHLFDICFVDENHGWAVGEWSTIIHTTDGGRTWERQGEESDKVFNNVFFADRKNGWLVGEQGVIMHTDDGGINWNVQLPKSFERASLEEYYENQPPALFGICFTDSENGYLCGIEGTILKTTDAGNTWDVMPSDTDLPLYTIFIKDDKGWAVGDKGTYLMSGDGGKTWKQQEDIIKSKFWLRDILFTSTSKGWAVGQGGTVIHTTDGGFTWAFYSGLSYAMEFFDMPGSLEFDGGVE
jgi:photosystem II stability/assembly factor-like uncharacterized protein